MSCPLKISARFKHPGCLETDLRVKQLRRATLRGWMFLPEHYGRQIKWALVKTSSSSSPTAGLIKSPLSHFLFTQTIPTSFHSIDEGSFSPPQTNLWHARVFYHWKVTFVDELKILPGWWIICSFYKIWWCLNISFHREKPAGL